MIEVTFHGVRGSTPCPCDSNQRYGGNTSCVGIAAEGHEPVALDLGTGMRFWGLGLPDDEPFHGHALLTHMHWDHVQGLPFFTPINQEGATLDIYAPRQETLDVEGHFRQFMQPPYFPIEIDVLVGDIRFHDLADDEVAIGDAKVKSRMVPHIGPTLGFRVELEGGSVAYIPDHQQPLDGSFDITDGVMELCENVDLLIHDAQYTAEEWQERAHWGHCSIDYALHIAREAGARQLALFHHDPGHTDDQIDQIMNDLADDPAAAQLDGLIAASEGLTVELG